MNPLRPDEQAANSVIERNRERDRNLKSGVKTAAAIGTTAALGAGGVATGLASRVMPFLSSYLTPDIAIKGLSKVSPPLGALLKKGQGMGLDVKQGLEFIREQMQPKAAVEEQKEENKEPPKEKRSILEQYSPALHSFIKEKIGKGYTPIAAGRWAMREKQFESVVKKIVKDHKIPWDEIVEGIFGSEAKAPVSPIQDMIRSAGGQPGDQSQSPQQMQPRQPHPNSAQGQQLSRQGQQQQGDPQIKERLLQTMQALTQQLRQ